MPRLFVTGDTHGDIDWHKLNSRNFPEQKSLTKDDYVIVLGDFGAVWGLDRTDRYLQDNYSKRNFTTLFIDGNHENHDALDSMPVTTWNGGKIHKVTDSVFHLMRGQVFELCGKKLFTMGGARSSDIKYRKEGVSWWPREMPSQEEYDRCTANLERVGWSVDYVFTHEVPYNVMVDALDWNYLVKRRDPDQSELSGYLQWVDDQLDKERLKMWYAGHHHVDRPVMDEKHCVLYQQIVELGELPWA